MNAKGPAEMVYDTAIYKSIPGCDVSSVPDGYVVHQASTEKVHYLNPSAAIVYELCDGTHSIKAIAEYLKTSFALAETPDAEVRTCIESLAAEGLIVPC